jgi:hypothetical protein
MGVASKTKKGANGPRKGEGISQGKQKGMEMMGKWMEVGTHLGIKVKLTVGFPSSACWDGWDAQQHFGNRKPTRSAMVIPGLTYLD